MPLESKEVSLILRKLNDEWANRDGSMQDTKEAVECLGHGKVLYYHERPTWLIVSMWNMN